MTKNESKPNAAFTTTFPHFLPNTVGSHLDSLESINKNTASCDFTNASSFATSFSTASSDDEIGCPGMGIPSTTPWAFTPGKISCSFFAAVGALGSPPLRQSENVKSGWRTGFE